MEQIGTTGSETETVKVTETAPRETVREQDVVMPYAQARKEAVKAFEQNYVTGLLRSTNGNVTLSAKKAGVDRVYLHRLMRKHGLRGVGR